MVFFGGPVGPASLGWVSMFNGNPKGTTWYHKKDRHHPYIARPDEGILVGDQGLPLRRPCKKPARNLGGGKMAP